MGSVPAGEEIVVPDGEVIVAGDELPPVREDGGVILGGNPMLSGGDFLEDHPDLVKEFLEMHEEATLYINDHLGDALGLVNTEIESVTGKSIDTDVIENAFTRIEATAELNKDAIMSFARISLDEGFTNSVPEESDVFNTELRE